MSLPFVALVRDVALAAGCISDGLGLGGIPRDLRTNALGAFFRSSFALRLRVPRVRFLHYAWLASRYGDGLLTLL